MKIVKPSKNPNEVVAVQIGKKLNVQVMKGQIGNMKVVPEPIRIRGTYQIIILSSFLDFLF